MSIPSTELSRKLGIKINIIKRKEIENYGKECKRQGEKVEQMRNDGGRCPHEISKQMEVEQETLLVLRDCERKLSQAQEDLKEFLGRHTKDDFEGELYQVGQDISS